MHTKRVAASECCALTLRCRRKRASGAALTLGYRKIAARYLPLPPPTHDRVELRVRPLGGPFSLVNGCSNGPDLWPGSWHRAVPTIYYRERLATSCSSPQTRYGAEADSRRLTCTPSWLALHLDFRTRWMRWPSWPAPR